MRQLGRLGIVAGFTCLVLSLLSAGGLQEGVLPTTIVGTPLQADDWDAIASAGHRPEVAALHAREDGEVAITMSDSRVARVGADGQVSIDRLQRAQARRSPPKVLFSGRNRWVIEPPAATLLDEHGSEVRSVVLPPFTTSVMATQDGGLAFLTPGAPTFVTVMNPAGLFVASFGEPIRKFDVSPAQERFLNEGTLLETRQGHLVVVFLHQPHPTLRRYSRSGELLGETLLRSPGLDRIATAAEARIEELRNESSSGGRVTVFGTAYDRFTDTIWVTTASDDGLGAVRIVTSDGQPIGQVHLSSQGSGAPIVARHLAFGGRFLYWADGSAVWRADVSGFRRTLGWLSGPLAASFSAVLTPVAYAQQACGTPQSIDPTCPYNCTGGSITCEVASNKGSGWILEAQHCLQPPSTPANFKGCEKSATWCHTQTLVRDTDTDRKQCPPADEDADGYTEESGDCNDYMYCANPGAWGHAGTYCDTGACEHWDDDCNGVEDSVQCNGSPIVVDVARNGYDLSSAVGGVYFDLNGDGVPEHWSWTKAGSDDAWLALDQNGNGVVDNGMELFGNFTDQPASGHRNGYVALAVFDESSLGGNEDGIVDSRDSVFPRLRLWRDVNHDGVSEAGELVGLWESGIRGLSLDYRASRRVDEHGNRFAYTAPVTGAVGRNSYDVFLVCDRGVPEG